MNKADLLGRAAIEYAAEQVVTERAAAKELRAQLDAAIAEAALARQYADDMRRHENEQKYYDRKARSFLERVLGDMEKIDKAPFWRRRSMLRDLIQKAYWV